MAGVHFDEGSPSSVGIRTAGFGPLDLPTLPSPLRGEGRKSLGPIVPVAALVGLGWLRLVVHHAGKLAG